MKRVLYILTIITTLSACNEGDNAKVEINSDGVAVKSFETEFFSFNYPEDWDITDSEEIDEGILYVAAEKDGFDSSGLVAVVSFNELMDLDELVMMNIAELQGNPVIGDFDYAPIEDDQYNKITSRTTKYKFKTLGLLHTGTIQAFTENNNSYVLLIQGAIEDATKNVKGFTIIENSFQTKSGKVAKKVPANSTQ